MDQFNIQGSGLKVKVTVAIFRKNFVIALAPTFIDGFQYNFTQVLGMIISRVSFDFQGPWLKVKVTGFL